MKVVIDDYRLEKMEVYTNPLNDKIKRQAAEITRLLRENEDLKNENLVLSGCIDGSGIDIEHARAAGQQEAWELAKNIALDEMFGGYKVSELKEIFGLMYLPEIFRLTYSEAAAKVAAWEKAKEELCVGDEVELTNGVKFFLTYSCDDIVNGVSGSGRCFEGILVQECKKTGRHFDIASMLAQIGGEE